MKDMELERAKANTPWARPAMCEPGLEEWALWKVLSGVSAVGKGWDLSRTHVHGGCSGPWTPSGACVNIR